jgi:hypothetical protein
MNERDMMRWVWRGIALVAVLVGWVFIAWIYHFHISAPLVFLCLGWLAVVMTVYNLWRTGAAAVASDGETADSTWAKPAGALGELEREKRTLLKAIKEAEFDHQMGKLSQRDVDDMIRTYRARAIEVIKEIDKLGHGITGTKREQILREVRARLEVEARSQKKGAASPTGKPVSAADAGSEAQATGKAGQAGKSGKASKKKSGKDAGRGEAAVAAAENGAPPAIASPAAADAMTDAASGTSAATAATAASDAAAAQRAAEAGARARQALDDEAMDADSTTAIEPTRDDPAKEATP